MKATGRPQAADYKPRNAAERRAYAAFCIERFEPFDLLTKLRRKRRMSVARAIAQARKAGVDVIVERGDGTRFTFRQNTATDANAPVGNEFDNWMEKRRARQA